MSHASPHAAGSADHLPHFTHRPSLPPSNHLINLLSYTVAHPHDISICPICLHAIQYELGVQPVPTTHKPSTQMGCEQGMELVPALLCSLEPGAETQNG